MIVPVDGAEVFCSMQGRGPVCLVPTAIGTRPYELLMPQQLRERLTLVYVDLRGGGRSTGDPADLTLDVLAADFDAVRRALGVDRVAILGHSVIGVLAIEYARREPASVSHVIAVGTPPYGDMSRLSADAAAFFAADASADRKTILRNNLAALPPNAPPAQAFLAQTPTRFFDARLDAGPLFADAEVRPRLLQHLMSTLTAGWEIAADVAALRVPLLIAHGRYDYTVPHVLWHPVVSTLPNATLRLFERSGHQPFFEQPDEFAGAVADWMRRVH